MLLGTALLLAAGCRTHESRLRDFRDLYHGASFAAAQAELDVLIADASDLEVEAVAGSEGLAEGLDVTEGETLLYLLDRAMTCLGTGEVEAGTELLRLSRDRLDEVWGRNLGDFLAAVTVDDETPTYSGHDYEHVLVRAMLALFDLATGRGDAYAYALQLRERQDEIVGSEFGEEVEYNPRAQYQRVAIGAYLAGLVKEGALEPDEARLAYRDAREYFGPSPILDAALARTGGEAPYAAPGEGVLHVFYLAGRGPFLEEAVDAQTEVAAKIAAALAVILASRGEQALGVLFQGPVEVPAAVILDGAVSPLAISSGGRALGATEVLLDVNEVVLQQLAANRPLVMARAIVRRTLKGATATKLGAGLVEDDAGLTSLFGALQNLAFTAGERADTRCWSTLPAQLQVARIALPEGDSDLDLGAAGRARVRITRGRDSYLLVLRPDLSAPGVVLVDAHSRPRPVATP